MTWPDSSKQPSDVMINESDLLISEEYSVLYQTNTLTDTTTLWG